jgi:hypothetical protein
MATNSLDIFIPPLQIVYNYKLQAYIALVILCGSQVGVHPQPPKCSLLLGIHGYPLDSTHIFHSYITSSTIE